MKKLLKHERYFQRLTSNLKMKLSLLFLFTSLFTIQARVSYSQGDKISVKVENQRLEKVLSFIEKTSDYNFVYKVNEIDLLRPVSLNVTKEKIENVPQLIFKNDSISYQIFANQIILKKKPSVKKIPRRTAKTTNYQQLVKGTIVDDQGMPLPGINVVEKGTNNGSSTNFDGVYEIEVGENAILVFSGIGFKKQEITVNGQTTINATLQNDTEQLENVVVIALGIKKEERALTYAVTEVDGDGFTQAKEVNLADALSGKIAGVSVSNLTTGAGGSSRVTIRGNTSLSGDNQPLYVINGMPMDNTTLGGSASTSAGGFNIDHGDGTGGINPDDIETISVLKGATAAALYGSRASNGAIIITTKKGSFNSGIGIEFNSSFTVDSPMDFTDWQYEYGQGNGGQRPLNQSNAITWGRRNWGERIDGQPFVAFDGIERPYVAQKNNIDHFYENATTFINTIALSGGSEKTSYRFSISDTDTKGVVPNNSFNRRIFSLNLNSTIGERLDIEGLVQFNRSKSYNRSSAGDATGNPNWVNMLANTVDVRWLDPGYDENGYEIEWNETPYASNPYFVANKFKNEGIRDRYLGQVSLNYRLLDNLSVRGSVSRDYTSFDFTAILPTGTLYTNNAAGEYHGFDLTVSETNSMLTVNYNEDLTEDINLGVMAGGNIRKYQKNHENCIFSPKTLCTFIAIYEKSPKPLSIWIFILTAGRKQILKKRIFSKSWSQNQ